MRELVKKAKKIENEIVADRRFLHAHAETGFDLPQTLAYVFKTLQALGYTVRPCGKAGLVTTVGNFPDSAADAVLLRADMDALPVQEKSGLPFACKTGNMHACGHDTHTAMLLGAARLLKTEEKALKRPVKLLFQAAEETLEGAKDVLKNGVLDGVSRAVMLHVLTGIPLAAGTLVVPEQGVGAPAADYFQITVRGKACHGSAPQNGVDALTAAAHILLALQELSARELPSNIPAVLTVGKMQAGVAGNAVPDFAELCGTLRAMDENLREYIKKRVREIVKKQAEVFRAKGSLRYTSGCPALQNDGGMVAFTLDILRKTFAKTQVLSAAELGGGVKNASGGSEDFAYIAREVPSVMIALAAGEKGKGYEYPLHHPKARFDENALHVGAAALAAFALV